MPLLPAQDEVPFDHGASGCGGESDVTTATTKARQRQGQRWQALLYPTPITSKGPCIEVMCRRHFVSDGRGEDTGVLTEIWVPLLELF